MAGAFTLRGAYALDGGAAARTAGGAVHPGHDGIGLHLPAEDCGAGSLELRRPTQTVLHPTLVITPQGLALGCSKRSWS